MAYCTQTDLEAAAELQLLIDLTDDEKTGSINATRLTRAIVDADATIDGHLRARYSVPLASTPAYIRKLSVDLTLHALYSRRSSQFELPQGIRDRYRSAMDALRAMRDGKLDLGVEPPPAASAAIVADVKGPERLCTADTMKDF